MDKARTFPGPWRVVEFGDIFRIEDATGQHLAFLPFEDGFGGTDTTERLTKDEARKIANIIARMPDLLRR